ncbi:MULTISPECIES: hypothetical protein [Arthrospira]|nr:MULTISPECIES: hypothetical protein [Arthrospira]MBD2667970.1 hypothetical protein [Arthrospira platensis FACHB-439]MBD2710651.1 hypothetical protein [Arthrospira platensis FACHB-835]MDF2211039.1 hypothetical protein [Arthrospira platensis NCB002]MDT9185098.1 hypothetical protein [Limnospira sp. PMC 289.06]MDT9296933.1 hypothetical protein [Arthrospira platensis PCC 7345]MDT9310623.1 hypothetical protein [Limnospira sp. Paracas R14]QQW30152.1 hypothetical protein AP9108_05050 [Arthrospira 
MGKPVFTLSISQPYQRNPEAFSLFVMGKDRKSLLELDGVFAHITDQTMI